MKIGFAAHKSSLILMFLALPLIAVTACSSGSDAADTGDAAVDVTADVNDAAVDASEDGIDAAFDATFEVVQSDWHAQWIGFIQESQPNQWITFRNSFTLDVVPTTATVKMACDSKYWLWVNGEMVVFEGQLKRGPTPRDTYFDTLDLAPYLKAGTNNVAVLVWYWGNAGFSHNSSGRAGLVFELQADETLIKSDSTWKILQHPAFGETSNRWPNYRLSEYNVMFDARLDMPGWTAPDFDDSSWEVASELGVPPTAPWNDLIARPIPQWRNSGLRDFVNAADLPQESDGPQEATIIVAKLPFNAQVTPYFRVTAPAGLTIGIQTDNYRGGGMPNVRAEYITREGTQEFESFGWMNGHDVQYTIPGDVTIHALKYRETGYDADSIGTFLCDDPALNTLWEKARRTLYVTMRDNYMDCPDRERAQWWGDAVNELGESFYVFDSTRGPMLTRKAILELAKWQRQDGTLYSPVPSSLPDPAVIIPWNDGSWWKELPAQMLASVGWYGFWTYYWYSGDVATITEVYPVVKGYLDLWQLNADGRVIYRSGDWDWSDWGENSDADALQNIWYFLALRGAAEMARLIGEDADVTLYEGKLKLISNNFNTTFWNGTAYRSPAYTGATDDRANALAVVAGLAGSDKAQALRDLLAAEQHASPYMEKYVLEALLMLNAPDQAFARMKQRYADQIISPLTTLWEGWGIGDEGYGGGTYNHAWSGGPLTILSQYVAGVAPTSPAWKTYQVLPQMGALKSVSTVTPTPYGLITLDMTQAEGTFDATLDSPAGTVATFGLPLTAATAWESARIDDEIVILDGHAIAIGTSRYLGEINGRHAFELSPGFHHIEASVAPAAE
jgi:hypothetical protein